MKFVLSGLFFLFTFLVSLFIFPSQITLFAKEEKGAITGDIRFLGVPPGNQEYIVNVNPEVCGKSVQMQDFIYNTRNHGVKNVFVSLKNKSEEARFPRQQPDQIILNNEKCRLEPSVLGATVNQIINVKNSDPLFHALQFLNDDRLLFNMALPKGANMVRKKLDQPGLIHVRCTIHPFMQSMIYVVDSPLFTLTDLNGAFQMDGLNPGKYLLKIWHKSFKPVEKEIEILPGQAKNISIELEKSEGGM